MSNEVKHGKADEKGGGNAPAAMRIRADVDANILNRMHVFQIREAFVGFQNQEAVSHDDHVVANDTAIAMHGTTGSTSNQQHYGPAYGSGYIMVSASHRSTTPLHRFKRQQSMNENV